MQYNLDGLKLLAQGGEADLYEINDCKILRIKRTNSSKPAEMERIIFPILEKHNILVPKVYEYMQIDGRPAEIMERIHGDTMLRYMISHPFRVKDEIKQFAKMHQKILCIHEKSGLYPIEKIIENFEKQPLKVEKEIFDFVMQILEELPNGDFICHGDFHPGNILIENNKRYIIDWSGVHTGNSVSDIAHTYLLMTYTPLVPGQGCLQHKIISFLGRYVAELYRKEMHRLLAFDWTEFDKWLIVMSLYRIYHGLPSEEKKRKKYLTKAYCTSLK